MTDDFIPDDVRDFILTYLDSIAQLEALLLLRDNASETWIVAKVAKRLYTDERLAASILTKLCTDGLLVCKNDVYHFQCADTGITSVIDKLASIYARHIVPVTNIIHSKPPRIHEFADAFRIKKDR
jgi:hypothetical protein